MASGRQATRIWAYGTVPRPAETCSQRRAGSPGRGVRRVAVQTLGAGGLEVAVGRQRAARPAGRPGRRGCGRRASRRSRRRRTGRAPGGTARARPRAARRRPGRPARRPSSSRSYSRCGSSTPAKANRVSPTVERSRRLVRSSQPAAVEGGAQVAPRQRGVWCAACRCRAAGSGPGCAASARSSRWSRTRRRPARRAARRGRRARPARSRGGRGCRRCRRPGRARGRPAPRSQSCLRAWPGVRWMSLRCSTRSGALPGGQQRHRRPGAA